MKKLLLSLGVAVMVMTSTHLSAQDCSGNRYKNDIFTDIKSEKGIKYGENYKQDGATLEELFLDIYYPENDTDNNRTLIVMAHGGSFIGGNRADLEAEATRIAKKGYVVASISYRLLNAVDPAVLENVPMGFKKAVVRAIHDMKAAIRFLRNSANEGNPYGINPDIVLVGGVSAGAIMANHVTYLDTEEEVPAELKSYMEDQGGLEGNSGTPGITSTPQMALSMCGALLDTAWVSNNYQPFYGVHTEEDQTVKYLYGQPNIGIPISVDLYGDSLIHKQAAAAGIPTKYKHYPTGGHCQFGADYFDDMMNFTYKQLCEDNILNTKELNGKLNFSVYPNPVKTEFTIEIPSNKWEASYELIDMLGKTVLSSSIPSMQVVYNVNVSDVPAGIYQVRVRTNDGRMAIQKLVIE